LVLVVDEAQELFGHSEYGEEAGKLAEAIIKRGRALAVIAVFATQRPDAKSLPTGVSTNVGVGFCLRVMDQVAKDMVLGTSSYKTGIRATTFTPSDKGIGYLVGVGDEPMVVRTYYVDTVAAARIAERARLARERAGTLSGTRSARTCRSPRPRRCSTTSPSFSPPSRLRPTRCGRRTCAGDWASCDRSCRALDALPR
jgi:S-DNA-T family DNA segregation ATPase FtsK/SpoIIIE